MQGWKSSSIVHDSVKHLLCAELWTRLLCCWGSHGVASVSCPCDGKFLENLWGSKEALGLASRGFGEQRRGGSHDLPHCFAGERTKRPFAGQDVSAVGKG